MTLPRPIKPGDTHFITRRCSQRMFFLKPRPIVQRAFLYVTAIAAERYDIELHGLIVMSNHWHALVTDPGRNLPDFIHYVHKFVSKILNCSMGRFENLWSNEKTSIVTLAEGEDILDKLAYLMANPVEAQLVSHGKAWPGVRRMWQHDNETTVIQRPEVFYSSKGKMPTEVTLKFTRPPGLEGLSDQASSRELCRLVNAREAEARKCIKGKKNARYMGVAAILSQRITATPSTYSKKFGISPRVGAKNQWARIETLGRLKSWYQEYRKAFKAWREGKHDVTFPYGTYALERFSGVTCAAPA